MNEIILLKVQDLVSFIIEKKNFKFIDAVYYLYESISYENLTNEETKLWHLSTPKLFEILEIEKTTKEFIYPDFV